MGKGVALHLNKLESPSAKDALCQVWLKLAQWFWRRRWNVKSLGRRQRRQRRQRRTTDKFWSEKLTWAFGSGELKKSNAFWKDVFNSWLKYIETINNHPNIKDNFPNIPVGYNSNKRVANKTVFIKSCYEKGIKVLQDLFDEDCNLLVFEAFKWTYNIRNICIMQYNSITTAILKYLRFFHVDRTFVKLLPNPCIPIFFQGETFTTYWMIKRLNLLQ